ncbi:DUF4209 domain-containing protein [Anaeromicrobium sediminis]|uniref:DUF4209 domain-containing protein n=1 Tax=Anaeromicrobium sediminis TaxID=1478221 RepID=A0A267MRE1_9FIRM|nr:hypothetical protein [Anaeromicrobium sediminis]PAB61343.1 hypothetical protein CCE28_02635 [Anaeromicrobium sediminis]
MNIVVKLNTKENTIFTLENYGVSDMSTPDTIKSLIKNSDFITHYYMEKKICKINNINEFIDYLFLVFINSYENCVEYILDPYKKEFEKFLSFATSRMVLYSKSCIINYIRNHYKEIFSYEDEYIEHGLHELTLKFFIEYNKGIINSGIMDYLIENKPIFVFDNLDKLYSIIKKYDNEYLKKLFTSETCFQELSKYRFNDVCNFSVYLYKNNSKELVKDIEDKIYTYCMQQLSNIERKHVYNVQLILNEAQKTLVKIKSKYAPVLASKLDNITNKASDYLREHGQVHEYELSSKPYYDWMKKLDDKNVDTFSKYMTISHDISSKTELWESRLQKDAENYKPSIVDLVSTSVSTNDYFSYGKIKTVDLKINYYMMSLYYWVDQQRSQEFIHTMISVIESIYSEIGFHYNEEDIVKDVIQLKAALIDALDKNENNYLSHMTAFFTISFLEKILRNIYCQLKDDGFFLTSSTTLGSMLGKNDNVDSKMEKIIGTDHIKWIRYYFLSDGDSIGENLRNRIAHFKDIRIGDIQTPQLIKIVWLVVSTINSILINIMNNDIDND